MVRGYTPQARARISDYKPLIIAAVLHKLIAQSAKIICYDVGSKLSQGLGITKSECGILEKLKKK